MEALIHVYSLTKLYIFMLFHPQIFIIFIMNYSHVDGYRVPPPYTHLFEYAYVPT